MLNFLKKTGDSKGGAPTRVACEPVGAKAGTDKAPLCPAEAP